MQIRYLYNDLKVNKESREYIEKRLEKLEKLLEKNMGYEVDIKMNKKGLFRVEVMINVPRKLYRAEETTESIEGSIDIVVDELQQQIRRDKDKTREIKERGARSIKKKMVIDKKARF